MLEIFSMNCIAFTKIAIIYNNEEKDSLSTKSKKIYSYKKLRPDDYQYESEEEEEGGQQQTSKKPDKKEPPKNHQKMN